MILQLYQFNCLFSHSDVVLMTCDNTSMQLALGEAERPSPTHPTLPADRDQHLPLRAMCGLLCRR